MLPSFSRWFLILFFYFLYRVTSLSAKEIKIGKYNATTSPGNYVDFGTASLSLNLLLGSSTAEKNKNNNETFGSQSQPDELANDAKNDMDAPAIEEIFYSSMHGARISRTPHNGTTTMEIFLPKLSQGLLDAGYGSAEDDTHHILITFESKDLENMCGAAPVIVSAMERAGISLSSVGGGGGRGGAGGSGGGGGAGAEADTTQRPKKVSL